MGTRNPHRRHAKAVQRKKLKAERRRLGMAETKGSLAEEVRRARTAPLHSCLVQSGLFETGMGMVFLTRKIGEGRLAMAGFLVDAYCSGVKHAYFRETDGSEIETLIETFAEGAPFEAADPPYARKLLRDAVAYARSLGLEPHADYAAAESLFGDVAADACDVQFQFGREGRPAYTPGPAESPTQIRRRLDRLSRRLGANGFEFGGLEDVLDVFEEPECDDDYADIEDADIEGAYDPAVAPDPLQWLSLGEQERVELAEDYHRRAGVSLPNETIHAVMHAVIENQIALGDDLPVRRTVERLVAEGLDRHEAIHAAGSVPFGQLNEVMKATESDAFPKEVYYRALERLTAESWRRFLDGDED